MPGAAREREQREHEPHEGRVDDERRRDPSADAREDAVVVAALERQGAGSRSRRAHHVDPAGADAWRRSRTCPVPVWTVALRPSSCWRST